MFDQVHIVLFNSLRKCKTAARIYIGFQVDDSFFDECIRILQRELVLDLLIPKSILELIDKEPFALNKLLDLRARGVNLYAINGLSQLADIKCISQIDFEYTLIIKQDDTSEELDSIPHEELFSSEGTVESEYRKESDDIQISFSSNDTTIFKGKSTTINWEVKNADHIQIDGIGEVTADGNKNIQILDDTTLVLKASSKKHRKFKAVYLRAVENVQIDYDILFLNPASKQFVSLRSQDNYEDVFGVSQGYKLKLVWHVQNADSVDIHPFNLNQKEGEHIFLPNGSLEINIHVILQGETYTKRIIVHEFPMPVFTEKLVQVREDFTSKVDLNLKDLRVQARDFLEKNKILDQQKTTAEINDKIKARENELMDVYQKLHFNEFYQKHSIEKLNLSVINRIKSYFKSKPEVSKMIDLLHNHE